MKCKLKLLTGSFHIWKQLYMTSHNAHIQHGRRKKLGWHNFRSTLDSWPQPLGHSRFLLVCLRGCLRADALQEPRWFQHKSDTPRNVSSCLIDWRTTETDTVSYGKSLKKEDWHFVVIIPSLICNSMSQAPEVKVSLKAQCQVPASMVSDIRVFTTGPLKVILWKNSLRITVAFL